MVVNTPHNIHTLKEVLILIVLFILLLPLMVILECAKKS